MHVIAMIGLEILLSNQNFSFQNPKPIMQALKISWIKPKKKEPHQSQEIVKSCQSLIIS